MKKYFYRFIMLLVLLTAVLAGCSSQKPPPPIEPPPTPTPVTEATTEAEVTTITWSYWGDPWEVKINDKVVNIFEADNPNIKVDVFHRPWSDYHEVLRQKFDDGEPVPDVLFWSSLRPDVPKGYFMDLAPLMAEKNYSLDDFFPGLLADFKIGDKVYGLPRDSDTKVIFYNKRLFNQADVPYPKAGWTWDDLRQTSLAIKEANVTEYAFASEVNEWWKLWMWQNEIKVFDNKWAPTSTDIGEPAAAEAVQFFADMINVDKVTPPYEVLRDSEQIANLFKEEKVAMAFGNHVLIPAFKEVDGLEWDVVGLPQQKRRANVAGGAGYSIAANTKHLEAAWTFFEFLSGPKGQAIFAESGVAVPSRRSVTQSPIFMEQKPVHNAQAFLDEVEIGEPSASFFGSNNFFSVMNDKFLPPVWLGEQTAADAIQAALPEVERIIAASNSKPTENNK